MSSDHYDELSKNKPMTASELEALKVKLDEIYASKKDSAWEIEEQKQLAKIPNTGGREARRERRKQQRKNSRK